MCSLTQRTHVFNAAEEVRRLNDERRSLVVERLQSLRIRLPALRIKIQALQLDPSLQYAHYHLGLSYFQEQRYPEALKELQSAAQFDPQNAAAQ